jgi:beta-glucosidase-like glycosyl hydrolase
MNELAQLFLPAVRWDARRGYDNARELIDRALDLGVGGFILFGGETESVRALTSELRGRSRLPLLIGSDLERGAGQQFIGAIGLPPLAGIASLGDLDAMKGAASLTAREAKSLGVNWIYAPVCDLDIEPENPIVGTRSFGSHPQEVAIAATTWVNACQSVGALACAKHFPGHGRTTSDSHAELPAVDVSAETLASSDLVPFKSAVKAGVASVMTAHVAYPALDASGVPATLSRRILQEVLRGDIGFAELIVTDALIMEGVLDGGETTAVVKALAAGCDLLLYPTDLTACVDAISSAVNRGELDRARLTQSIEKRQGWAEWANSERPLAKVTHDDVVWAAQVADRVVHRVRGEAVTITEKVEVFVVDDDLGGPYPPPSREPFVQALGENGIEVVANDAQGIGGNGARSENIAPGVVIALFGDIRSWKGRPGYSAGALAKVAAALDAARDSGRDATIVQFSHPRLAPSIPGDAPIICAWGGDLVMQKAAARVLSAAREPAASS